MTDYRSYRPRRGQAAAALLALSALALPMAVPANAAIRLDAPVTTATPRATSPMFVENAGQFAAGARFRMQSDLGTWWVTRNALWLTAIDATDAAALGAEHHAEKHHDISRPATPQAVTVRGANFKFSFAGANPQPRIVPFTRLHTHVSYFRGRDARTWHPDVPVYGGVRYVDLYPHIDLELDGTSGAIQPKLIAHAGADLGAVRLHVDGAERVMLAGGALVVQSGAVRVSLPLFTVVGGAVAAQAPAVVHGDVVAPFAAPVRNDLPLASPALTSTEIYGTYLGGNGFSWDDGLAADAQGDTAEMLDTNASDLPVSPGAFQQVFKGGCDRQMDSCGDVWVAMLNPTGTQLLWSTYLGGSGADEAATIKIDGAGNVYLSGPTNSPDFPITPGAYQTQYQGGCAQDVTCDDTFVSELNNTGTALLASTYLGGNGAEIPGGITLDSAGNVYVDGRTHSTNFPVTANALQKKFTGSGDAYVCKLNATLTSAYYCSYLGGKGYVEADAIAIDSFGDAYVAGTTNVKQLGPRPVAGYRSPTAGAYDAFVAKVNPQGAALVYVAMVGGSQDDQAFGVAVDGQGNAYITGFTRSTNFPTTPGAFQQKSGGDYDTFVTKINNLGRNLIYSTLVGGNTFDEGYGLAVNAKGDAYVAGETASTNFPLTADAIQTTNQGGCLAGAGCGDGFVYEMNATGAGLLYSTYFGGAGYDEADGVALDSAGNAYVAGGTLSANFPVTPGAFQQQCPNTGGDCTSWFTFVIAFALSGK